MLTYECSHTTGYFLELVFSLLIVIEIFLSVTIKGVFINFHICLVRCLPTFEVILVILQ